MGALKLTYGSKAKIPVYRDQPAKHTPNLRITYKSDYVNQREPSTKELEETGYNNFELRLWNGRIGRWQTMDPYNQHFSLYVGMSNNPISFIDPDGGYDEPKNGFQRFCNTLTGRSHLNDAYTFQKDNPDYDRIEINNGQIISFGKDIGWQEVGDDKYYTYDIVQFGMSPAEVQLDNWWYSPAGRLSFADVYFLDLDFGCAIPKYEDESAAEYSIAYITRGQDVGFAILRIEPHKRTGLEVEFSASVGALQIMDGIRNVNVRSLLSNSYVMEVSGGLLYGGNLGLGYRGKNLIYGYASGGIGLGGGASFGAYSSIILKR